MNSVSICGIVLAGTLLSMLVMGENKVYGKLIGLAVSLMLVAILLARAGKVFSTLTEFAKDFGLANVYIRVLLKMFGITMITEITADLCTQAENPVCAKQLKTLGRFFVLTAGLPLLTELVSLLNGMMR